VRDDQVAKLNQLASIGSSGPARAWDSRSDRFEYDRVIRRLRHTIGSTDSHRANPSLATSRTSTGSTGSSIGWASARRAARRVGPTWGPTPTTSPRRRRRAVRRAARASSPGPVSRRSTSASIRNGGPPGWAARSMYICSTDRPTTAPGRVASQRASGTPWARRDRAHAPPTTRRHTGPGVGMRSSRAMSGTRWCMRAAGRRWQPVGMPSRISHSSSPVRVRPADPDRIWRAAIAAHSSRASSGSRGRWASSMPSSAPITHQVWR
jgi:hypothetical protein